MQTLEQMQQHIPAPVQHGLDWSAIGAAGASFAGVIQGPLAVIASLLSIVWLSLQIYSKLKKRK